MKDRISIVIPAYNEKKRIGKTLEEYAKYFRELKKKGECDFEILVVLNACKDGTLQVIKEYKKKYSEILFLDFEQGGKGFAITEGFKDALKRENDFIGFVDADMATKPQAFYDLVKNIGSFKGIIASRYVAGAKVFPKRTFKRFLASRIFNVLIRLLLVMNYRDTQCGAKVFRKEVIKKIVPEMSITQWAFDVNLLYLCKTKRIKVKEHATVWEDKDYSKINLKSAGLQMFSSIVRLRLIYSPLKGLIKSYDRLPEKIKIHHKR